MHLIYLAIAFEECLWLCLELFHNPANVQFKFLVNFCLLLDHCNINISYGTVRFTKAMGSSDDKCFVENCSCAMYYVLFSSLYQKKLLQSTLGFETLDKAAALGLETSTPLTDPRQYINSNLGFRNLKI